MFKLSITTLERQWQECLCDHTSFFLFFVVIILYSLYLEYVPLIISASGQAG